MRKEDDLLSGLSQSGAVVNSKSSWPMFSGMPTKREMRPDTEFTDLNKKHDMKKTFFRILDKCFLKTIALFIKSFLSLLILWVSILVPHYAVAQTSRDICIQQNPRGMFDCSDSPSTITDWSWSLSTYYDGPKTTYLSPVASEQELIAGFMQAVSAGQSALIPNFCGISVKSMGRLKEGRAYFERGTMLNYLTRDVTFNLCYMSINSNGVTETIAVPINNCMLQSTHPATDAPRCAKRV